MKPIGGYFEWEFPSAEKYTLHENAVFLNSGRHSFEYILRGLPNVRTVWIPYFTCDVVLQPLQKMGLSWKFYHINEKFEIADKIKLSQDEILVYTNYYGIMDSYCKHIVEVFKDRVVLDNAQALFCKAIPNGNQFYSPRKFMGLPDGGIVVATIPDTSTDLPIDYSFDRCSHLLKRLELVPSDGYGDFKANSRKIAESALCRMSNISKSILFSANLDRIKQRRRENFSTLHKVLAKTNRLVIPSIDSFECPLIYPYWSSNGNVLKKKLIEQDIFVATYWPNVFDWAAEKDLEYCIANNVVCLPIDQRYDSADMERITKVIQEEMK
ncbi:MAG: hypothetical protein MJZ26_00570 [Fibrobacter sp.]|nr:hypothetical protein [Fibrobacter sp.]